MVFSMFQKYILSVKRGKILAIFAIFMGIFAATFLKVLYSC